ncbi:hypothetical protein [Shewanella denitrificans]|uniref:hypothetical protein n=1 Tax=Shewanella denitrificans TaxID=192073 RepID=UPI0000553806|nr:hypothetical protein [Shewanella denitrificans]
MGRTTKNAGPKNSLELSDETALSSLELNHNISLNISPELNHDISPELNHVFS